jgi:uncharacterized membrane protein (GlpM family)
VSDIWPVVLKGLNGGLFVVAFSLLGEAAVPKRFAGLFSAAPSIALGSLLVTALVSGRADARENAYGMIVGAAALVFAALVGFVFLRRHRAKASAAGVCAVWLTVAGISYAAVWR